MKPLVCKFVFSLMFFTQVSLIQATGYQVQEKKPFLFAEDRFSRQNHHAHGKLCRKCFQQNTTVFVVGTSGASEQAKNMKFKGGKKKKKRHHSVSHTL